MKAAELAEERKAPTEAGSPEEAERNADAAEEPEEADCDSSSSRKKKRVVPGIVYLGHVPPRFRPLHVRNLLSAYGEVGRVFFQAEGKPCVEGRGWRCRQVGTIYCRLYTHEAWEGLSLLSVKSVPSTSLRRLGRGKENGEGGRIQCNNKA